MGKVVEIDPEGTVTEAGTDVPFNLELMATCIPPGPAGPVKVRIPVAVLPPTIVPGETATFARSAVLTQKSESSSEAPSAVWTTTYKPVSADTGTVEITNAV